MSSRLNIVTGAFGFSGKYITERLLSQGEKVKTLTGHPERPNPFGDKVKALPYNFDNPEELTESLRGAATLYNTYWIRFSYMGMTFDDAVRNSKILIKAAEDAEINRIVHISITNPSIDSPLPYFNGKALVEKAIMESNLSYAILRPAVLFGPEDILINNMAYLVRRMPFFTTFGRGDYKLQPIFVEDLADLAVKNGHEDVDTIIDAVGPEIYTFDQLIQLISLKVKEKNISIIHLPPSLAYKISRIAGFILGDEIVTGDEVRGLMGNLLVSKKPPSGHTKLSEYLLKFRDIIGKNYSSELKRHYK